MATTKKTLPVTASPAPPAVSRKGRQSRMENLALDLIERKLIDGTASSQETVLFARSASTRGDLEEARLKAEVALLDAKKHYMESQEELQKMFKEAIEAMGSVQMENVEGDYGVD